MAEVAISTVTEGELRYGVAQQSGSVKLQMIVEEFLLRVTILPRDSEAARQYGYLRASLETSGQPNGQPRHHDWRTCLECRRHPGYS